MNSIIKLAIDRPVAVVALIFLSVLFGYVALQTIPIQMSPDIEKPIYQVRVNWAGASPADVDREVVNRLERELSSLNGVEQLSSSSRTGRATVTLTYSLDQDMDKALILLLSKLSGITGLPDDAKTPTVRTSNSDDSPIARLALIAQEGVKIDLEGLGRFVETDVVEPLGRTKGVSEVTFNGGGRKQMRVVIDPEKMTRYQISLAEVIDAIKSSSTLQSVGSVTEGKRSYPVRTELIAYTREKAGEIVIRTDVSGQGSITPLFLSDVADIELKVQERRSYRRLNGEEAVTFSVLREQGTNVVSTMKLLRTEINKLNQNILKDKGLELNVIFEETTYISSAINLVKQNIWIGGCLAICVLMLFLRSLIPTSIIFIAIPVSVIGTFVAIAGLGLSINVISLAGLAFSIGMVVDASIVSMENIFRLRQKGLSAKEAAYNGARQVWAPILGSALTTVIVFIPVVILKLPVGQLFRDIGIAISVSVLISVVVSVTVIPSLASRMLTGSSDKYSSLFKIPILDFFSKLVARLIVAYANFTVERRFVGLLVVLIIITVSSLASYKFLPRLDYLPDGNANFVFGRLIVPTGYSMKETLRITEKMESAAKPLWEGKVSEGGPPAIDRFFFVAFQGGAFAGAAAKDGMRVSELKMVLMRPIFSEPGARAFVGQASLFGRSVGGSRSIDIDVIGPTLDLIEPVVRGVDSELNKLFPRSKGNQIRILPSLDSGSPQILITPDPSALARAGISIRDFSSAVDVFNDGVNVTQIPINGDLIDLVVTGIDAQKMTVETLGNIPIITRSGNSMRLDQLASVEMVSAAREIRRLGGRQAISIRIRPENSIALEDAVRVIENDVIPKIRGQAAEKEVSIFIRGAASELARTWASMKFNVLTAIGVIFLLLVILLRSFVMPIIILLVIPVASTGGIAALAILNQFVKQPLDMLTMLGFVILTGIVVNNAILLVEQTVLQVREEGMDVKKAIIEATRNRIRPIFMSTLTSLFGLVPLVVFPGAGSELYRGIGVVVFGGLALSTLATLIIVPPLLSIASRSVVGSSKSN
mgnify:FL=1